jgi:hypothetical protein
LAAAETDVPAPLLAAFTDVTAEGLLEVPVSSEPWYINHSYYIHIK